MKEEGEQGRGSKEQGGGAAECRQDGGGGGAEGRSERSAVTLSARKAPPTVLERAYPASHFAPQSSQISDRTNIMQQVGH